MSTEYYIDDENEVWKFERECYFCYRVNDLPVPMKRGWKRYTIETFKHHMSKPITEQEAFAHIL